MTVLLPLVASQVSKTTSSFAEASNKERADNFSTPHDNTSLPSNMTGADLQTSIPVVPSDVCTSSCHVCAPPDENNRGCSSCGKTCHENCSSLLCQMSPCADCLSLGITTHEGSELCQEVQDEMGCHACSRHGCHVSAYNCHMKCSANNHVCTGLDTAPRCSSCAAWCHLDSSDFRCPFFGRARGVLDWEVPTADMRDTEAGTQGQIPHRSQVDFTANDALSEFIVNGLSYKRGRGEPGSDEYGCLNNCLIDSLRQTLGLQCDCTDVRRDLQQQFSNVDPMENRRYVDYRSYLDVRCHWRAILRSLFSHSIGAPTTSRDPHDYRIITLSTQGVERSTCTHGAVEGDANARYTLVILNVGDVHFDPCLRCE